MTSREQFEAWRLARFCGGVERLKKCSNAPDVYYYTAEQAAWLAWQASRAVVVVELPDPIEVHDSGDYQMDTIDALEAAGIRVKP